MQAAVGSYRISTVTREGILQYLLARLTIYPAE